MQRLKLNRDRSEMLMELLDQYINQKPVSGAPLVKGIEIKYGDLLQEDMSAGGSFEITPICNTVEL